VYAFLRAFELEAFASAGADFRPPVLDLGSGDGTFGALLRARGVLAGVDLALEFSEQRVRGLLSRVGTGAVRGDARELPFRTSSLGSVFSNGVVCCIPTDRESDVDRTMAEAYRVLAAGGVFALSVATTWYNRNLPLPRLLRRAGAGRLADRYLARLDRGLEHYQVLAEESWIAKVDGAGFRVERVLHWFTPRQAAWWNALTVQGFRVFALSRLLGWAWLRRIAAGAQRRIFGRVFRGERELPQERLRERSGYILIVARKA
jgi:SAM-dependent methyltransferase